MVMECSLCGGYSFPVANCLSHYFCFLLYSFYEFVYMYFGNIFISYVGPNKSESGRRAIQCQMMVAMCDQISDFDHALFPHG